MNELGGLILYSDRPDEIALFYRTCLGIPFEYDRHGQLSPHLEADHGSIHFAIFKSNGPNPNATVVPSFRVSDLPERASLVVSHGARALHDPLVLGGGTKLISFRDPDGRQFRLIEIGHR